MQKYEILARIKFITEAETINKAVYELYKALLPKEAYSYDELSDSMMISYQYLDFIVIEEIRS